MPILLSQTSGWTIEALSGDHGLVTTLTPTTAPNRPLRWALLADTHISANPDITYGDVRPLENAVLAIQEVAAARPDAVIVDGDLAWLHGLPEDYAQVERVLEPLSRVGPVALIPGNHDRRDNLLRRFAPDVIDAVEPAKAITVIETPDVRVILLDSLYRTDVVPGLLGQAQRNWLASTLDADPHRPVVLFVHHHLGPDDSALLDGDRLLAIVHPRRQVKAVFCAHEHAWRLEQQGRLHIVKLPSAAFAFTPAERIGWVEAEFDARGARLRFHAGGVEDQHSVEWRP